MKVNRNTEKVPTNTLFLTFNTPEMPKEITVGYLKVNVASTATSLATRANVARLLRSVSGSEKANMKIGVRDPSCALIAMVPMPHRLKVARSGRRKRRFNESALKNTSDFRKPDSW